MIVDASPLSFIDAAGLSQLIELRLVLSRGGMGMRVEHASERVRRLIDICNLGDALGICRD